MAKGGESLGNEEGSEEEEEVIAVPTVNYTPGVRPLTLGVIFSTVALATRTALSQHGKRLSL
jgi:hypothetical protein